ncbi:MAG: hypothetical protein OXE99_10885 [Cellvibrionales bacterium]|nr:hypothetical protein [Cellvibrionales bacterium]
MLYCEGVITSSLSVNYQDNSDSSIALIGYVEVGVNYFEPSEVLVNGGFKGVFPRSRLALHAQM